MILCDGNYAMIGTRAKPGNHLVTYKEKRLIAPLYKAIVRPHIALCKNYTSTEAVSQEGHGHT